MEVYFTTEQEAQLRQFAASEGNEVARVVEETMARVLQQRAESLAGVERGIMAADNGELVDHDEVIKRLGRLFQS